MKTRLRFFSLSILASICIGFSSPSLSAASFTDENPQFKRFLFKESDSRFRLGFGLSPFQIIKDKPAISVSLFQLHLVYPWFAWEIVNASFALTFGSSPSSKIREIVLRTTPQVRLGRMVAIGVLLGYEYVSFPDVQTRLTKATLNTEPEPFSSGGMIYGGSLSETFNVFDKYILRAEQIAYRQNYRVAQSENGWAYTFTDTTLNQDRSDMKAGWVIQASFSFLY